MNHHWRSESLAASTTWPPSAASDCGSLGQQGSFVGQRTRIGLAGVAAAAADRKHGDRKARDHRAQRVREIDKTFDKWFHEQALE